MKTTPYRKLALTVIKLAVKDLRRKGPTHALLRDDAREFFFSPSRRYIRDFWLSVAGFDREYFMRRLAAMAPKADAGA